jgi:hypothetical protein
MGLPFEFDCFRFIRGSVPSLAFDLLALDDTGGRFGRSVLMKSSRQLKRALDENLYRLELGQLAENRQSILAFGLRMIEFPISLVN